MARVAVDGATLDGATLDGAAVAPIVDRPIWIADSKVVYRPGQGLADLERGVQAALGCCGALPGEWAALWPRLTGVTAPCAAADPCCADFDCKLPLAAAADDIERATQMPAAALRTARVRLVAIRSRAIFARDGGRCAYCRGPAETIDHVMPRSRGGGHQWENVVAACARCNHTKGDKTPAEPIR